MAPKARPAKKRTITITAAHPEPDPGTWHKSACILGENNCGIQILTQDQDRRFLTIRGDKEHVSTHGCTCNKALRLDSYQNGSQRLTSRL